MLDKMSVHVTVTYSFVNHKTNLIEISQMEGKELDADDELPELRNGD